MPLGIDTTILKSTVYLYPSVEAAERGLSAGGSGFILGVMSPVGNLLYRYVVTNKHVVQAGHSVIRSNTWADGVAVVETVYEAWTFAKDDDLAVVEFDAAGGGCIVMDEQFLEQDCQIDGWELLPGDEVFLFGRFVTYDGQQRNKPVVRFGNISMMPDVDTPVRFNQHEQVGFLVECRSLSGFSGSPAFVHLVQPRMTERKDWIPTAVRFLGVDCGHLPFWARSRGAARSDAPVVPNSYVETNSGMAVIVPAWRLKQLIDDESLVRAREAALVESETHARYESAASPGGGKDDRRQSDETAIEPNK